MITDGQDREITGHLQGHETDQGRSLVYDLEQGSTIKQVDHRTINWIIFKNVKYTLGKSSNKEELPLKPSDGDRWDGSRISVGQWFSATSYYQVKKICDDKNVLVSETRDTSKAEITMARDILETEMHSGLIFDAEEKISRTEMI